MNIEQVREYCLQREYADERFPFDEDTMVFCVGQCVAADGLRSEKGKTFALMSLEKPDYVLLKCEPELAIELRERYPLEIEPGWHMNKRHWNGVWLGRGGLTDTQVREMIDWSYQLAASSLPRWVRTVLEL